MWNETHTCIIRSGYSVYFPTVRDKTYDLAVGDASYSNSFYRFLKVGAMPGGHDEDAAWGLLLVSHSYRMGLRRYVLGVYHAICSFAAFLGLQKRLEFYKKVWWRWAGLAINFHVTRRRWPLSDRIM